MLFGNTITACEVVKAEERFCPVVKKLISVPNKNLHPVYISVDSNVGLLWQLCVHSEEEQLIDCFRMSFCAGRSNTAYKTVFKYKENVKLPQFIAPLSLARIEKRPSLFCCNKLWLVTLNGPEPESAVQLSEAVVGGRVPRRLAQQTVCGVFG